MRRTSRRYHLQPIQNQKLLYTNTQDRDYSIMLSHFYSRTPIDNTLVSDWGIGIGGCHFMVLRVVRWGIWVAPISSARVAWGARRVKAWGRMVLKCSTARRVTTSVRGKSGRAARASARSVITVMLVNVSARATSLRKAAFL